MLGASVPSFTRPASSTRSATSVSILAGILRELNVPAPYAYSITFSIVRGGCA